MGADMILSAVAMKQGDQPDFEAGRKFIEKLTIDEELVGVLIDYGNLDEGDETYFDEDEKPIPTGIRTWLVEKVQEFEDALDSRQVTGLYVRDLCLYVTGGMSWGDDTDAGYAFRSVEWVPGLLESMNFVTDWAEPEKPLDPAEEAAAIDSIKQAAS